MGKCCGDTQKKLWAFGMGIFLMVSGLTTFFLWERFIETQIHRQLVIREGSLTYDKWVDIPIPIHLEVYLFNWTNPDKVKDPNIKPNFTEIGPYVWVEKRAKKDIVFHDNGTVSFWIVRTWHFSEELTKANLEENITCVNLLPLAMAHEMRHKNAFFLKTVINPMINRHANISITHPARKWIFEGYNDKLLDIGAKFGKGPKGYDKFGWFYNRNGSKTFEGRFNIDTGKNDINNLGNIYQWNFMNQSNFFEGECGIINGTTGDAWMPHMDPEKSITMFTADLCRPLNLLPSSDNKVRGIKAKQYSLADWSLGTPDKYANMKCFCPDSSDECLANGVADVSVCRNGAPSWVSSPHFFNADESFRNAIEGMKPIENKHNFFFTLEPTYSIPLEVSGAFQVNLRVKHYNHISIYKNANKFLAPMLWMRQYGGIDNDLEKEVKLLLALPSIGSYVGIALACIGGLLLCVGLFLTFRKKQKSHV